MTALELLQKQFPGVVYLSLAQVSVLSGFAVNTIRNRIREGVWPIPVHKDSPHGRVYFDIRDVAIYIEKRSATAGVRKRGRPTKAEQMMKAQAAN